MEPLNPQSAAGADDAQTLEQMLQTVRQDLINLHQNVVTQLAQDVTQLRQEKAQLTSEIEQLKAVRQSLPTQQALPSEQQLTQQQLWAKQLAQILAAHLQKTIVERLDQIVATPSSPAIATANPESESAAAAVGSYSGEEAQRLLASLDVSFSATFKALQRELNNYHSNLFQQISRMQDLEQQGEVILTALVRRLQDQLQVAETSPDADQVVAAEIHSETTAPQQKATTLQESVTLQQGQPTVLQSASTTIPTESQPAEQNFSPDPTNLVDRSGGKALGQASQGSIPFLSSLTPIQIGFLYAFLSTIAFSIHNVVVRVIGRESSILGLFRWGGAVPQLDLGNSLMTLWLRMMVVLPLMLVIAKVIYPHFWEDIQWRFNARDRRQRKPLVLGVISGIFLFFSQICIYVAIGRIGAGAAVTLLFMYPLFTVLLSWLWFKKMRPTRMLWAVIGVIFLGVLLTVSPGGNLGSLDRFGIFFAFFAGIFFALYMTWMDLSFEQLKALPPNAGVTHQGNDSCSDPDFDKLKKPILITLIQFTTVCLLSNLILLFPINLGIRITKLDELILGGLLIGSLALVAYLLNNFAVQKIGPESASIMSSLGPVLTALFAFLLIRDPLKPVQWFGIVLVTTGVAFFTLEKNALKTAFRNRESKS